MTAQGIEGALTLVNLGIRSLTALQVGGPILQHCSDLIANAIREGRELTPDEIDSAKTAAEDALLHLETQVGQS